MKKVKLDVIKPWMTQRITELLGVEDELVIDFAFGLLEEKVYDKAIYGCQVSNAKVYRIPIQS